MQLFYKYFIRQIIGLSLIFGLTACQTRIPTQVKNLSTHHKDTHKVLVKASETYFHSQQIEIDNVKNSLSNETTQFLRDYPTANHGKWVLIIQQKQGNQRTSSLVMTDVGGENPRKLLEFDGRIDNLSATADATSLIFSQQANYYPSIYQYNLTNQQLTKPLEQVIQKPMNYFGVSLSHNQQQWLFSVNFDKNPEIYWLDLLDNPLHNSLSNLKNLNDFKIKYQRLTNTTNNAMNISPIWSPNGQSFLYVSDNGIKNQPQIYQYDWQTKQGKPLGLSQNQPYQSDIRYRPDGKMISFFTKSMQNNQTIWHNRLLDLSTGEQVIVRDDADAGVVNFSPNSDFVIYAMSRQVVVMPIEYDKAQRYHLGKKYIFNINSLASDTQIKDVIWLAK
ncbi:PD40 domain-containing protein [Faucicola boevrei]|uniref:PD40 domain-containing protein n=1 Tax=Faucicola boevrei TaxID=346665 RepID=UPI000372DC36|nr:PD40 domain-containing protein [Moraxella boevrei]